MMIMIPKNADAEYVADVFESLGRDYTVGERDGCRYITFNRLTGEEDNGMCISYISSDNLYLYKHESGEIFVLEEEVYSALCVEKLLITFDLPELLGSYIEPRSNSKAYFIGVTLLLIFIIIILISNVTFFH